MSELDTLQDAVHLYHQRNSVHATGKVDAATWTALAADLNDTLRYFHGLLAEAS